ncbi:DUF4175 family protein [Massilia arenosa]|uniref:DUF4175 family protein n=1 Tax=Zemynaea arenosa TaxID=2561931 RepID=A0A4Y9RXJ9_9BURK|nr:DUF4175 family protein [Massilia arenosa]TFW13692.1 DUF4175 family protein [Massilia arenosa]
MSAAVPDIVSRLRRAVLLRRAPAWLLAVLPWLILGVPLAALLALAFVLADAYRLVRRVDNCWPAWLDDCVPELEDSSRLLADAATPLARLQQARLIERASTLLDRAALTRIAARYNGRALPLGAISMVLAALWWFGHHLPQGRSQVAVPQALAPHAGALRVSLHVTPPAYTGVKPFDSAPRDIQVPAGSRVSWCVEGGASKDTRARAIELSNGQSLKASPCVEWTATESIFWRWYGTRYTLRVTPDEPPRITLTTPKDMLTILSESTTSVALNADVTDDYKVAKATLHLTLARGSGENIRFSDREVPIDADADLRTRKLQRRWTLKELGMEPGDELYFFIRASDNAEPAHQVQSPTYTLRLPGPVAESEDTSAVPVLVKPESLRSQRQIIIDTEQLIADMKQNPRMAPDTVRARSEAIASDQALLRRRYGQFLGEESSLFGGAEHDEPEHKGKDGQVDVLAEYGHAHDQAENATLFDDATKKVLRRALSAMWDAEKALRAIAPRTALPPEYTALDAIKQLQQADRIYLHKTAYAPPPIKEEIRMSGDVVGVKPYKREQDAAPEAAAPSVRALLTALGNDQPLPALWTREALDFLRERVADDEQRLAAQRAVQDVADGCVQCRPVLRAWLRGALGEAPLNLQAPMQHDSGFARKLRGEQK